MRDDHMLKVMKAVLGGPVEVVFRRALNPSNKPNNPLKLQLCAAETFAELLVSGGAEPINCSW